MIVDLHVHTSLASRCSSLKPLQLIERARELGLNAVAVTDHSTRRGAEEMFRLALPYDFKVFRGMEVYTELGDMLVFGWSGEIRYYLYPFRELRRRVEEAGGVIIPAHPCRGTEVRHPLKRELPSELREGIVALEVRNGACKKASNLEAESLAERYGLFGTGGSDAHHVTHLGTCVTVFEEWIDDEAGLIEALRSGRYRACYYEEIDGRPWPAMEMKHAGY